MSGSIAPSALFTSCDTVLARSAIACFRSAVSMRAWSDSVRVRFWMATAACERKRSTSSASNGFSRPGCRDATFRMPNHAVAGDQRRAQHRCLARVRAVVAVAVVVEQPGEPRHRLAGPRLPVIAVAIEPMDLGRGQHRLELRVERQREADMAASRFRPGDLLGDQAERVLAPLANQQRRRVVVVGQRSKAVQDLVEEVLRVDQLHDLAIDAVAHVEHPFTIHRLDGIRDRRRDPRQQPADRRDRTAATVA